MEIVPNRAQDIIAAHNEAREHGGKAIEAAVKCGTLLIEQMKSTPKGGFTDWIEANCPNICRRTAYNYMTLAKRVQHVAHIDSKGLRQAYIAAGILKEQPKEVRDASEDMDALLDLAGILGTKWKQWENMFERMLPSASDEWLAEQAQLLRGPHDRYEQIKEMLTA